MIVTPPPNPSQTTVELVQGEYWRVARLDANDKDPFPVGQVHMLKSIRDVDGVPHTIIIDGHPGDGGNTSYRFLVDEFLSLFEPISQEEAAAIRQREIEALQRKLSDIQAEMANAQANPKMITAAIEPSIREWEKTQNVEPGFTDNLKVLDADTDITPALTVQDVAGAKLAITRKAEETRLVAAWFGDKAKEMTTTVNAMVPYFKEKAEAALAKTEDVRRMVTRLTKGIQSLDLYVGTGVEVETLRKGESAPDTVKLTIKQAKLYVDEELCVWSEVDENFDFRDVPAFCKKLAANEGLINQIFPTERSLVCMATTRQHKDYKDVNPFRAAQQEIWNREVFLLVRDGGTIHYVVSSVESHLTTEHLFPSENEIQKIFEKDTFTFWGEKPKPKEYIPYLHTEYTDRVERHDAVALHYRRFLILLGGLDHRLNLFGRFHNEPQSMAFFSERFQQQNMIFLRDDEINPLQLTGTVKEPFWEFARRQNKYLRSGSRVVCDWRNVITRDTAPSLLAYDDYRDNLRVELLERTGIRIVYTEGKKLCVKCPVEQGYKGRRIEAAINLAAYRDHHCGFLVLDRLKSSDLFSYIHDRQARKEFLGFIRMFKRAALYLQEEETRQKPTIDSLAAALVSVNLADDDKAGEIVHSAVAAWRSANRGAEIPAPSDPKYKQLLNQIYALAKQSDLLTAVSAYVEGTIKESPLRLCVTGTSKIMLYTAPNANEREDRLFPESWVKQYQITQNKSGLTHEPLSWVSLPEVSATETVVHEWPEASEWIDLITPMTREERRVWLDALDLAKLPWWTKDGWTKRQFDTVFEDWKAYRDRIMLAPNEKRVRNPCFYTPICIVYTTRKDKKVKVEMIAMTRDVAEVLYLNAPTPEDKDKVAKEYLRWYKRIHHASIFADFQKPGGKLFLNKGFEYTEMGMVSDSRYSTYTVEAGEDPSSALAGLLIEWGRQNSVKYGDGMDFYMADHIRCEVFPTLELETFEPKPEIDEEDTEE